MVCGLALYAYEAVDSKIARLAWITMFTAYLRPADLHALRGEDLAAPAGSSQWWALNLHPAGRGDESKVGLSDESLLLDAPYLPGLGAALATLARDREGEKLFERLELLCAAPR